MLDDNSLYLKKAAKIFAAFFKVQRKSEAYFLASIFYVFIAQILKLDGHLAFITIIVFLYIFCFIISRIFSEFLHSCEMIQAKNKGILHLSASILYCFSTLGMIVLMGFYFLEFLQPYGIILNYWNIELHDKIFIAILALFLILYPFARHEKVCTTKAE